MKCSERAQEAIDKVRQQRTAGRQQKTARGVKKGSAAEGKTASFTKAVLAAAGIFFLSSFVFVSCATFLASFEKQKQAVRSSARTPAGRINTNNSASVKKRYGQEIYKWVDANGVVHLSNTKDEEY